MHLCTLREPASRLVAAGGLAVDGVGAILAEVPANQALGGGRAGELQGENNEGEDRRGEEKGAEVPLRRGSRKREEEVMTEGIKACAMTVVQPWASAERGVYLMASARRVPH